MTPTSITLEKMDFAASGPYACEIALEIPLYSKASKIHEVSVIGEYNPWKHPNYTITYRSVVKAPYLTLIIIGRGTSKMVTVVWGCTYCRIVKLEKLLSEGYLKLSICLILRMKFSPGTTYTLYKALKNIKEILEYLL